MIIGIKICNFKKVAAFAVMCCLEITTVDSSLRVENPKAVAKQSGQLSIGTWCHRLRYYDTTDRNLYLTSSFFFHSVYTIFVSSIKEVIIRIINLIIIPIIFKCCKR